MHRFFCIILSNAAYIRYKTAFMYLVNSKGLNNEGGFLSGILK